MSMMSFHKRSVSPFVFSRVLLRMYDEDNPPFWRLFFAPPLIDSFGFHAAISMATHTPPKQKRGILHGQRCQMCGCLPTFCIAMSFVSWFGFLSNAGYSYSSFPPFFFVLCAHHFRSLALVIALTARAAEWLRPCPRWIY